jgi:hypothetical protein
MAWPTFYLSLRQPIIGRFTRRFCFSQTEQKWPRKTKPMLLVDRFGAEGRHSEPEQGN